MGPPYIRWAIHLSSHLMLTMPAASTVQESATALPLEYIAVATIGQIVLHVDAFEMPVPRTQLAVHLRAA